MCCFRSSASPDVPQRLCSTAAVPGRVGRLCPSQLGLPIASTAPLARITETFDKAVHRFARDNGLPWVNSRRADARTERGRRLPGLSHPGSEGVLFVGRAQEKTKLFAPETPRRQRRSYPWIVAATGLVNHFVLIATTTIGPCFLKFCSYFPYNANLWINGNHWAERQAAKAGIGFSALATVSPPSTTLPRCSDLRWPGTRADRRLAAQVAGRSGRTRSAAKIALPATATTCRSCKPSSP